MFLSLYKHFHHYNKLQRLVTLLFLVLSISTSITVVGSNVALANGETYTWVDQTTINGTGGIYKSTAVFKKGSGTNFSLSNEVVVKDGAYGPCVYGGGVSTNPPVNLTVNTDNSSASLIVENNAGSNNSNCVQNYGGEINLDSSFNIGGTNPYKNGTPPPATGDPSDCSAYGEATTKQTCQIGFDAQKNQPAEAYNLCDGSRLQQITSGTDGTHDANVLRAACFRGMTLAVTEQFNNIAEEYARAKCNSGETGVIQANCLSSNTKIFQGFVKDCSDQNATIENPDERSTKIRECLAVKAPEVAASINKVGNPGTAVPDATAGTTCAVDGIGWIICPVMRFMAKVTDSVYSVVADMLTVNPVDTSTSSPMYQAWSAMRNFANAAFVVAFLIIIFSQVTSVGISNYGVKKLLPKLILVAILVNTSYWLCAIAVDVSNILGNSLKGVIEGAGNQIFVSANSVSTGGGGAWDALTVGILAGAAGVAVLYLGLTVLLPILISVLFIIISAVVVLTLRQALLVLLIVVAPLAFVALLLPNTESMFKKWKGLFQTLLVMFPIIAVVFGASKLASIIITGAASQGNNIVLQLMGAAVTILPLVLFPKLMALVGDVGNKVGAFINNPNRGPFDRMRKGAANLQTDAKSRRGIRALDPNKRSMFGRGAAINRRNRIDTQRSGRDKQFKDLQEEAILSKAATDPAFARSVAGANATGYQAQAQAKLNKIDKEKIENEQFLLKAKFEPHELVGGLQSELSSAIATANDANQSQQARSAASNRARAAAGILASQTGGKGVSALRETLSESNPGANTELGQDLRKDISAAGLKGKDAGLDAWSRSAPGTSLTQQSGEAGTWSGLSHEQIAGQTESAIKSAHAAGGLSGQTAADVLSNDKVSASIGAKEKAALQEIAATANYVTDVGMAHEAAINEDGRRREAGREENIDIAHEEADMLNALHDMEHRSGS